MQRLINNVINGNLADAKRQAKRFKADRLISGLRELAGYSERKAIWGALWLKGCDCWQQFCDAK